MEVRLPNAGGRYRRVLRCPLLERALASRLPRHTGGFGVRRSLADPLRTYVAKGRPWPELGISSGRRHGPACGSCTHRNSLDPSHG